MLAYWREKRDQKALRHYADVSSFIIKEHERNPELLIVGYFYQKAKIESSPLIYAALTALVVNLSWQFIANFITSISLVEQLPPEMRFRIHLFCLALNFVVLAATLIIVYMFYHFNRKEKKEFLLREHILRKNEYIG